MKNGKLFLLTIAAVGLAGCGGGGSPATITSAGADSRLHQAVQVCDDDGVNHWIYQGANPNMRFSGGSTILQQAVGDNVGRCFDVIESLLRHGADVNLASHHGHTPLMSAALHGWHSVVIEFLQAGANVNAVRDDNGWTALMFTAQNGHELVAKRLLQNGADASITDDDGDTALDIALRNQHTGVVVIFQQRGITQ